MCRAACPFYRLDEQNRVEIPEVVCTDPVSNGNDRDIIRVGESYEAIVEPSRAERNPSDPPPSRTAKRSVADIPVCKCPGPFSNVLEQMGRQPVWDPLGHDKFLKELDGGNQESESEDEPDTGPWVWYRQPWRWLPKTSDVEPELPFTTPGNTGTGNESKETQTDQGPLTTEEESPPPEQPTRLPFTEPEEQPTGGEEVQEVQEVPRVPLEPRVIVQEVAGTTRSTGDLGNVGPGA